MRLAFYEVVTWRQEGEVLGVGLKVGNGVRRWVGDVWGGEAASR